MKFLIDTNTLISNLDQVSQYDLVISSHVLRELDKHKSNRTDSELAYRARRAVRYIKANKDKITLDLKDYTFNLNTTFEDDYVDNKLIQCCVENDYGIITNDVLLQFKAEGYGIPYISLEDNEKSSSLMYTGIMEVEVFSEQEEADIYEDTTNKLGLLVNQYLVIKFGDEISCTRWDGEKHVDIDLPPKRVAEPQNYHQACALDMLWNKNIPIKILAGTHGSGKTFMAVKVGLEFIKTSNSKKHIGKMMMVRNL
jgi:predicted ribonuclease YlaK